MRGPVLLKWFCVPVTVGVLLGAASIAAGGGRQSVQVLFELPDHETFSLFLEREGVCDDLTIHGSTLDLTMDCPRGEIRLSGTGELRYAAHVVSFYRTGVKVANVLFPLRTVVIPLRPGSFLLKRDGTIVQNYYRPFNE